MDIMVLGRVEGVANKSRGATRINEITHYQTEKVIFGIFYWYRIGGLYMNETADKTKFETGQIVSLVYVIEAGYPVVSSDGGTE